MVPIQPAVGLVVAGRYRLSRLIGRGGMGSVWMATHLGLDVPCAVKFIEGEGAALPEAHARFEREAKAAAQLRSPHVVQILDHGIWEGTPYIAMELLEGEDLGSRLMRVGRLPPQDIVPIVAQVCRALARAHALGVVHRDLKPDNVFLVRDDDRELAKVLDFGIAKATVPGVPGAGTRTGALLGTPYYMSPEQAQGTRSVDARSDLWSLAVIVFQALTGRRPFESDALGDLLMRIIVAPIPRPSEYAPDLPPALDAWWAKASQREPAARYQTARQLSDSLGLVFGRQGDLASPYDQPSSRQPAVRATPPSPEPSLGASTGAPMARTFGERSGRLSRRTRLVVCLGAATAVVGGAALGLSVGARGRRSEPERPPGTIGVTTSTTSERALGGTPAHAGSTERLAAAPPALALALPDGGHPGTETMTAPTIASATRSPSPKSARVAATAAVAPTAASPVAPRSAAPAVTAASPSGKPADEKKKPVDLGI